MKLRLPILFWTCFRRGKDFDKLVTIVPFSLYSTVEMKPRKFVSRFLGKRQLLSLRVKLLFVQMNSYLAIWHIGFDENWLIKFSFVILFVIFRLICYDGNPFCLAHGHVEALSLTCKAHVISSRKNTLFFDLWHGKHSISPVPVLSFLMHVYWLIDFYYFIFLWVFNFLWFRGFRVGSGWLRFCSGQFRLVPAGSGLFRQVPGRSLVLHTPRFCG